MREWTFQSFYAFFSKSTFSIVQLQMPLTQPKKARDLLLVSFCSEFYVVWPSGLNSKPTTLLSILKQKYPKFVVKKIKISTKFSGEIWTAAMFVETRRIQISSWAVIGCSFLAWSKFNVVWLSDFAFSKFTLLAGVRLWKLVDNKIDTIVKIYLINFVISKFE